MGLVIIARFFHINASDKTDWMAMTSLEKETSTDSFEIQSHLMYFGFSHNRCRVDFTCLAEQEQQLVIP